MSSDKSSVSALHEYCAKRKFSHPTFEFFQDESGAFCCMVEVNGMTSTGTGRSKRDAKHLASGNFISKLKKLDPTEGEQLGIVPTPPMDLDAGFFGSDMVGALRDYCVQRNHPLPIFDLVQQGGTPDNPEFTISCSVATIIRYGVSDKKKDARQKAAHEILQIISENAWSLPNEYQVVALDSMKTQQEEERYLKFKTYRELVDSKTGEMPGVLLTDRHYFFTKFHDYLKKEAMKIINDDTYGSEKSKAMDVLRALKIEPTITTLNSTTVEPMLFFDLNLEYDVVFAAGESTVYSIIVNYFRDMLF